MKVNCFTHVFHLLNKIPLAGLQIYDNKSSNDDYDVDMTRSPTAADADDVGSVAASVGNVLLSLSLL